MISKYDQDMSFASDICRVARAFIKKKFYSKYTINRKIKSGFSKFHFYAYNRISEFRDECVFQNDVEESCFDLCNNNCKVGFVSYKKEMTSFDYFDYDSLKWENVNFDDYMDTTIEENHFMVSLTVPEQLLTILTVYYQIKKKFKCDFYLDLNYLKEMVKYLDELDAI